ncbi:GRAM domain-containing protein 3 [Fukomys damarensis]|uniref:GRAM domain-containing protein 3 n=1 Tax=Fukomys damarensis TaxID=885580 RepID=A0A091DLQ4_FUKDA|nr:GRAM domain-containing protein 3 [Fukomys damarensis]
MVKKRLSSNDSVFQFDIPGSPQKAGAEAPLSSTDSPSPVFLRNASRSVTLSEITSSGSEVSSHLLCVPPALPMNWHDPELPSTQR